jgi:hypothetical protein
MLEQHVLPEPNCAELPNKKHRFHIPFQKEKKTRQQKQNRINKQETRLNWQRTALRKKRTKSSQMHDKLQSVLQ